MAAPEWLGNPASKRGLDTKMWIELCLQVLLLYATRHLQRVNGHQRGLVPFRKMHVILIGIRENITSGDLQFAALSQLFRLASCNHGQVTQLLHLPFLWRFFILVSSSSNSCLSLEHLTIPQLSYLHCLVSMLRFHLGYPLEL